MKTIRHTTEFIALLGAGIVYIATFGLVQPSILFPQKTASTPAYQGGVFNSIGRVAQSSQRVVNTANKRSDALH